jgi:hypothetical protein
MNILALVNLLVVVLLMFGLFGGSIILQIFLSKKASKWPGLVLPGITFFLSILTILVIVLNVGGSFRTVDQSVVGTPDGKRFVVNEVNSSNQDGNGDSSTKDVFVLTNGERNNGFMSIIFPCVFYLFLINIPTAIYLAIYYGVRGKRKQQKELDKMKSLDL